MLTATGPVGQTHWGDSTNNNASSATHSADSQLKQELAAIFKKIGDKQTCTIGLYELYRITQLYPKVDIFSQLQNASEAFRTYIRDGLSQMEKNAAAGRTPTSLPLSTPPPSSLSPSSPEFAPLSPVHTNSLPAESRPSNPKPEPTNFNPTTENSMMADHRYMGGVTSGTLDAIRERMKSMQIASSEEQASMIRHEYHEQIVENAAPHRVLPLDEKALSGLQARMERLKSGSLDSL